MYASNWAYLSLWFTGLCRCRAFVWSHIYSIAMAFDPKLLLRATAPSVCGYHLFVSQEKKKSELHPLRKGQTSSAGSKKKKQTKKHTGAAELRSSERTSKNFSLVSGSFGGCWDEGVSRSKLSTVSGTRSSKLWKWRNPNVRGSGQTNHVSVTSVHTAAAVQGLCRVTGTCKKMWGWFSDQPENFYME